MNSRSCSGRLLVGLAVFLACMVAADAAEEGVILFDGIDRWRVERFCGGVGNRTFVQGRKMEGAVSGFMAFDSKGNAYMASGTCIVQVPSSGPMRIIAGTPGLRGNVDGPGESAAFTAASDIVAWGDDVLFVVDSAAFVVRRLQKREGRWFVTTFAGVPFVRGHRDGPACQALFDAPLDGVAVDEKGIVYVMSGDFLRRIADGMVETLNAGTGYVNGPLEKARFRRAMGGGHSLSYAPGGYLFVADRWNMAVRVVDLNKRRVSTYAGLLPGMPRRKQHDGKALEATFHPGGGPCTVFYNARYDFLLVKSADEGERIRIVKDGWMKSFTPPRSTAFVGALKNCGGGVCGVDSEGRCYLWGKGCVRVARRVK